MLDSLLTSLAPAREGLGALGFTALVVFFAEFGDKSQLVAMTLAARHRKVWSVLLGAGGALVLLSALGVLFGALVAQWLPRPWLDIAVAGLFLLFSWQALRGGDEEEAGAIAGGRPGMVLVTSFALVFLAEFGDKTQLAVAGLATVAPPWPVWLGGSLALLLNTALGVWVGGRLLAHMPGRWLHRLAGLLFLLLAGWTLWSI
ncbi:TMEM165/GDT1 family protein [Alkalilimnicola sp. S0819]|uniref:TMEM165/GDT1 family protein n=1 Tax=Alkalilimnicola sp. S0819 TaxID=2613922 RepID=UPI001D0260B0|nr:TMEM165/GDT1 family protein [Alkalilimnicola sp. S0819]